MLCRKLFFTVILSAMTFAFLPSVQGKDKIKEENRKMYFFGIARNYTDSIACLTDITAIDSVAIRKKDSSVLNIEMYTQQLIEFFRVQDKMGYICNTITSDNYKDLEKLYLKVKQRIIKDKGLNIQFIPNAAFTYRFVDPKTIYRNEVSSSSAMDSDEDAPIEVKDKKGKKDKKTKRRPSQGPDKK